jgi:hypothetical protein
MTDILTVTLYTKDGILFNDLHDIIKLLPI